MEEKFNMEEYQTKLAKALDPNNDYSMDHFMTEVNEHTINPNNEMLKIDVDFVNKSDNQDPDWETSGSSGFDLRASESGSIIPHKRAVVPTGLFFDLPENFEIQVRPRSGLAAKKGVTVLNTPGTIDADYTGEIKVILINLGDETFTYEKGDRIAQAVISTVTAKNMIKLNRVSSIEKETERGAGGFGHTGLK